jgi:hypothetical protein
LPDDCGLRGWPRESAPELDRLDWFRPLCGRSVKRSEIRASSKSVEHLAKARFLHL